MWQMHILHDSQYTVIFSLCFGHLSLSPVGEVEPAFFEVRRVSKYCREGGGSLPWWLYKQPDQLNYFRHACRTLRVAVETMLGLTHQSKQLNRADIGRDGNVGCALMVA